MPNSAEYYRNEARHAKRRGERASNLDSKRQWLAIEEGYRQLARSAEVQAKADDYLGAAGAVSESPSWRLWHRR
jgi:hypothetical protein